MNIQASQVFFAAALLVGLAACGNSDQDAAPPPTSFPPETKVTEAAAAPALKAPNPNKYLAAEIRVEQMIYDLSYVECTGPSPETGLFAITTQISRNDKKGPNFWVQGNEGSATMRFMPERSTPKNVALNPTVYNHTDAVHFDGKTFYFSGLVDKQVNGVDSDQSPLAVTIDCPE